VSRHEHPSDYPDADTIEPCPVCDAQTPHAVRIEQVTETDRYGGNQPYRITECLTCGFESKERIGVGGP
jgi:C4-type Zn-finger protein